MLITCNHVSAIPFSTKMTLAICASSWSFAATRRPSSRQAQSVPADSVDDGASHDIRHIFSFAIPSGCAPLSWTVILGVGAPPEIQLNRSSLSGGVVRLRHCLRPGRRRAVGALGICLAKHIDLSQYGDSSTPAGEEDSLPLTLGCHRFVAGNSSWNIR